MSAGEIVRGFWHGRPLSAYQLLCLRSFVDRGRRVEVFSYDPGLAAPHWVALRNANEIWPTDHVLHYQNGFGAGSSALHSNLFRYAMLHALGGWWIDLDIVSLQPELPVGEFFFGRMTKPDDIVVTSVLKFPAGHPLMAEARDRCVELGERCSWGQTGSDLLKELIEKYGMMAHAKRIETVYPVAWFELHELFDPGKRDEVEQRCRNAPFLHLFNELWRRAGIPKELGPPADSALDDLFKRHATGTTFAARMDYENVSLWLANSKERHRLEQDDFSLNRFGIPKSARL